MHQLEDATVQAFCDENDSLRGLGADWFRTATDYWGITTPQPEPPPPGRRYYQLPEAPSVVVTEETRALEKKLMQPNEITGMQLALVRQYMALGMPEAQAQSMATRQITAQLRSAPPGGPVIMDGTPGSWGGGGAAAGAGAIGSAVGGGGRGRGDAPGADRTPQIFGVPWYWVALGAAVTVVLLARR